jgi:hypothetical protein
MQERYQVLNILQHSPLIIFKKKKKNYNAGKLNTFFISSNRFTYTLIQYVIDNRL